MLHAARALVRGIIIGRDPDAFDAVAVCCWLPLSRADAACEQQAGPGAAARGCAEDGADCVLWSGDALCVPRSCCSQDAIPPVWWPGFLRAGDAAWLAQLPQLLSEELRQTLSAASLSARGSSRGVDGRMRPVLGVRRTSASFASSTLWELRRCGGLGFAAMCAGELQRDASSPQPPFSMHMLTACRRGSPRVMGGIGSASMSKDTGVCGLS